jgi:hypothetical protein
VQEEPPDDDPLDDDPLEKPLLVLPPPPQPERARTKKMADKLGERHFDNTDLLESSTVLCVEGGALVVRRAGTFMNATSVLSTSDQGERHLKKCAKRLMRGLHKLKRSPDLYRQLLL